MPLTKLVFKPGVNREMTTYSNEGSWYRCEKVRFRYGFPEKIGGWVGDTGSVSLEAPTDTFVADGTSPSIFPGNGYFFGMCKSLWNWQNLAGYNLLGIGTNLKFYIQYSANGTYYDVTPVRESNVVASNAFTTTYPTDANIVTCNVTGHNAQVGDFVTIADVASSVNGIPSSALNREFRVLSVVSNNAFTIQTTSATSAGTTGAATFYFQINTGNASFSYASGWGAGGWGGYSPPAISTGWGESAATGVGVQLRLWSQSNFGENLVFCPRGGAMNFWAVNPNPATFDRGQQLVAGATITQKNYNTGSGTTTVTVDSTCPSNVNQVFVSDATRFTIAFGCNPINAAGTGIETTQDPMLIRWSDQESYSIWTPAVDNQAGDYRLSQGSQIMGAVQTRQEILVFTDTALYSMQYIGAPYVWGFQPLGTNISVISPNSMIVANNVAYWMGVDKFYSYNGTINTLPCALRRYVFDDLNQTQGYQVYAGHNEGFSEIWWFYTSTNNTPDAIYPNSYVVYNYAENIWHYGKMERTCWQGSRLRTYPMATSYYQNAELGKLIYHENGTNDAEDPAYPSAINAYIESADFDIGDGDHFMYVWRIVPDVTFNGSTGDSPSVTFYARPRQNPGSLYGESNTFPVTSGFNYTPSDRTYANQQFTEYVYTRIRGRQMAIRIESDTLNTQWQLGSPRIDAKPDGRR
jgi:hypothetical protein